jgi:hypothetical protein
VADKQVSLQSGKLVIGNTNRGQVPEPGIHPVDRFITFHTLFYLPARGVETLSQAQGYFCFPFRHYLNLFQSQALAVQNYNLIVMSSHLHALQIYIHSFRFY